MNEEVIITPAEFAEKMIGIKEGTIYGERMYDNCNQHIDADKLMCDLLRSIGYGDGVDIFESMTKWYE